MMTLIDGVTPLRRTSSSLMGESFLDTAHLPFLGDFANKTEIGIERDVFVPACLKGALCRLAHRVACRTIGYEGLDRGLELVEILEQQSPTAFVNDLRIRP